MIKEKMKLDALSIEITRQCSLKCAHCLRGEAQDLTITPEIINRLFDDVIDCRLLLFTGGEPLLHIDLIDYVVDKIIENKWKPKHIILITNGTIIDERILQVFEKLAQYRDGDIDIGIRVSFDEFHDTEQSQKAQDFYTERVKKYNKSIYVSEEKLYNNNLVYSGRAIDYIKEHRSEFNDMSENADYNRRFCYSCSKRNHRIKVENETVCCMIELLANGRIAFAEDHSFNNLDKLSMGNIIDMKLSDIIQKHNQECVLLCTEQDIISKQESAELIYNQANIVKASIYHSVAIFDRILHVREKAHEMFPYVPMQEIIKLIPFPKIRDSKNTFIIAMKITEGIILHSQYKHVSEIKKHRRSFIDFVDSRIIELWEKDKSENPDFDGQSWNAILCANYIVRSNREHIEEPYMIYGADKDMIMKSLVFSKLATLNKKNKDNTESIDNSFVFPCEIESTIVDSTYNGYQDMKRHINKVKTDIKNMLPTLSDDEIHSVAMSIVFLEKMKMSISWQTKRQIKLYCEELSIEQTDIDKINPEWCRGFILRMVDIDKQRRAEQGIPLN